MTNKCPDCSCKDLTVGRVIPVTNPSYDEMIRLAMLILEEVHMLLGKESCHRNCGTPLRNIRDSAQRIAVIME